MGDDGEWYYREGDDAAPMDGSMKVPIPKGFDVNTMRRQMSMSKHTNNPRFYHLYFWTKAILHVCSKTVDQHALELSEWYTKEISKLDGEYKIERKHKMERTLEKLLCKKLTHNCGKLK